jgi:hypothetical protein
MFRTLNPHVQAIAGWLAVGGSVLAAVIWYIGRFSSLFAGLSVGDRIFLAALLALATLLALAVISAIFAWVFRKLWPLPTDLHPISEELERTKERLKRAEERLDGARVVEAVGYAGARSDEQVITPTSHKGKPLVRLTDAERNRVSEALLAIGDYLKNDFAEFLRPFQEMRNADQILRERGGAAYHAQVEAPRPTMREFIDSFTQAMKPYRDEMLILGLSVDAIKTKATEPLWRAVKEVSNVSQMLPEGACNGEALKPPLRQLGEAVEAVQSEVDRVDGDVKRWRLKISRGELG